MGEGAGVLVLEEAEAAARARRDGPRRGGGYGSTSDAYHLTAPEPDGRRRVAGDRAGARRRRRDPREIGYVNAHGTSTQLNDAAETAALKRALGEDGASEIPVSSTKSAIGHLLGAAGAVEAVATVRDAARPA